MDDPSRCAGAVKQELRRGISEASPGPASPARARRSTASLDDLFPSESEAGPGWLITREAAITEMDPAQRELGLLEIEARHYGRSEAGVTEVCSIELWQFAQPAQASAAAAQIAFPGWSFEARGALLITLRGTRLQRGRPFQKGLFPACRDLGALVHGL